MRRVVITGIGIVSCIGNDKDTVLESLKEGRSGITFSEEQKDMGFRSHVHGKPDIDLKEAVDRRWLRFMGDGAAFNFIAMEQAIADSGLGEDEVSNELTAMIMGSMAMKLKAAPSPNWTSSRTCGFSNAISRATRSCQAVWGWMRFGSWSGSTWAGGGFQAPGGRLASVRSNSPNR